MSSLDSKKAVGLISLVLGLLAGGCGGGKKQCGPIDTAYNPAVNPADFVTSVDNPLYPLVPGAKRTYAEGAKTVEITVLPDKKTILGVSCTTVHDVVKEAGKVIEDTYDWYAQDRSGNVWYFGEDTKELSSGGKVTSTEGSWEAGVDGGKPGYIIRAPLAVGQGWRQEYYACHAEDQATVLAVDASITVPAGSYSNCLKTHDFTLLDTKLDEEKYYCPGVGNVLTVDVATGQREELL